MDQIGVIIAGVLAIGLTAGIMIGLKARKQGQRVKAVKLAPWAVSYEFYDKK